MGKRLFAGAALRLQTITIRTKLLLSFFALIFIPLFILTAVSYRKVAAYSEANIRFSANQSFSQAYTLLNTRTNALLSASQIVCFSSDVQTILERTQSQTDIVRQHMDMLTLDNFFSSILSSQDVYRVSLYVPGWMSFADQGVVYFNMDRFAMTQTYRTLVNCKDVALWLPPVMARGETSLSTSARVISLIRKIRDSNALNSVIGAVQVSVLETNIQDILTRAKTTPGSVCFLLNSMDQVVCSSDDSELNSIFSNPADLAVFLNRDFTWQSLVERGRSYFVLSQAVENTDWKLIVLTPEREIYAQSNQIRNLMMMLMFALGVAAYALAFWFATSTTRRLHGLVTNMTLVQGGNFDVRVSSGGRDEIGKLIDSFNFMVNKIKILMQEQFAAGKEIKNAELKALQAQINPHFLYNTLDMINWKALDNDVPEIAEISRALSKFYKTTLSGGKDIVTVGEEMERLKTYVQIQNMRYDNRIRLELDVPDEVLPLYILKLILQPLVENSIIHGIMAKSCKEDGTVRIIARVKKSNLFITVRDDGVGMSECKANEILDSEGPLKGRGYGVRNIHERIRLCYGREYGLTYHSSQGGGTVVLVRLPRIEANESPLINRAPV